MQQRHTHWQPQAPMIQRFIQHVQVERPAATETAAEARERLREKFPRNATRRMTHLGMLLGSALDGIALRPDDAVVYASSYAETRALEEFLKSFPAASPLLFQTSIHPGGVQQVLIGRQQPVARMWPLAGRHRLVEQAITTALLESAPRVIFLGGEERGTWLLERGAASGRAFAFALVLTREATGSMGMISYLPRPPSEWRDSTRPVTSAGERIPLAGAPIHGTAPKPPLLDAFTDALAERGPLAWTGAQGEWSLTWS